MSNVLSVGDILEVSCERGVGYASYAGKHPWLGDALWIVPELFSGPQKNWQSIFGGSGYFIFYAAHAALRQKLIKKVGFSIEALHPIPQLVRTVVNRDASGAVIAWLITDGVTRTPRTDLELSAEERLLPIGTIWNHPLLCERIEARWSPEGPAQSR